MITHGTTIGENVICGPQVCICGSVKVGNNVFFGVGSVVRDKISITNDVKFRMTSIITKDIKVSDRGLGPNIGSDHFPLVIELKVP